MLPIPPKRVTLDSYNQKQDSNYISANSYQLKYISSTVSTNSGAELHHTPLAFTFMQ